MELTDMRLLGYEARVGRRKMVIKLRKSGATYKAIAEQTGLSPTGVFDICKRSAESGAKALKDAATDRQTGEGRRLSAEQEAEIQNLIADKMPDQLKMPCALWSRPAVSALIATRHLSSDSPDLNPNEMANAGIKQAVAKQAPARTKLQPVKAAARHLRIAQKRPARVRSYFQHDPVKYAA